MVPFAEWAYVMMALSFIPQTFYSILFEKMEVKRGAAVIYGLSCLGFAFGIWILELDVTYPLLEWIKWGLVVWSIVTIVFAFNFGSSVSAVFSYRNPAAFEFALLVYVFLLSSNPFMQNIYWLIIFTVAFLTVFNAIAYALSR